MKSLNLGRQFCFFLVTKSKYFDPSIQRSAKVGSKKFSIKYFQCSKKCSHCVVYNDFIGRSLIDSKAFIKKTARRSNLELSLGRNGHCADALIFFFQSNNEIQPRMHNCVYGWCSMLGFFYVQKIKATWKECLQFASKPQIKIVSYISAEQLQVRERVGRGWGVVKTQWDFDRELYNLLFLQ